MYSILETLGMFAGMIGFILFFIFVIQKLRKRTAAWCKTGLIICVAIFFGTACLSAIVPSDKKDKANQTNSKPVETEETDESTEESTTEQSEEQRFLEAIKEVVREEDLITFNYVPSNNFALIKFRGSEGFSKKLTVKGMWLDISEILERVPDDIDVNIDFNVVYPMVDKYGNTSEDIVIKATFKADTIKAINFENFNYENIPEIADEWWSHNALKLE